MDPNTVKSAIQNIAFGEAMLAAAKDYKKELCEQQGHGSGPHAGGDIDVDDLLDDPELQRLHADRIASLQEEMEKRARAKELSQRGHGVYTEITEGNFLEIVTKTERVVCHFFHAGFERCQIMDQHLGAIAPKYVETRFVKLSATDAPFFSDKLKIKVLPCVVIFIDGVAVDRLVGFDELGNKDNFNTHVLEHRLLKSGVVSIPSKRSCESDEEGRDTNIRRSTLYKDLSDDDSS